MRITGAARSLGARTVRGDSRGRVGGPLANNNNNGGGDSRHERILFADVVKREIEEILPLAKLPGRDYRDPKEDDQEVIDEQFPPDTTIEECREYRYERR